MKKEKNDNYVFVFYDVDEKRIQKVYKICCRYFEHFQESVFRGQTSQGKILSFENEIQKVIKENDTVTVISMENTKVFREKTLGKKNQAGSLFI